VANPNKPAKLGQPSQLRHTELVAPNQPNQSLIEEISHLLDTLPLIECVELTLGSSHLSQLSPLGQLFRGLCSK